MGYYDQGFLNYYYYMASQFAVSDRWFSPVSSKSIDNRIATFTGGTTQGLVKDPGSKTIIFPPAGYSDDFPGTSAGECHLEDLLHRHARICARMRDDCPGGAATANFPATDFATFTYSTQYLYENPTGAACTAPLQPSSTVGDSTNSFCIDTNHIAPISQFFTDLTNGTLPSFAFIEAGYGNNDEHPGSGQSILAGQAQVANIVNLLCRAPRGTAFHFLLQL